MRFDYDGQDNNGNKNNTSQIADSLKNLIRKAENSDFDSFWVMDHFHQIQFVGRPEDPMLEGWFGIYLNDTEQNQIL
jgi:alkanesulfonate monooxygenase SsuD/methylene tetrahydromethanopterin reductase-like flavin-dependent oxidoreductase (luciferase family)